MKALAKECTEMEPEEGLSSDIEQLKAGGIIKQTQPALFTLRLKSPGGRLPLEHLEKVLEVAKTYGRDYVHLSVRQSVEIPYVDFKHVAEIKRSLNSAGMDFASCGPRLRVPVACAGCEYNPNGLTDTQGMARKVCDRFFGKDTLPHKFKVTFAGCSVDCVHSTLSDLGFQGALQPELDTSGCIGCGACEAACEFGAITLDPETATPVYDRSKCIFCGECVKACPTESWREKRRGWVVRVGGKWGRRPVVGSPIAVLLPDEGVLPLIALVVEWYKQNATGRTRIGTVLQDEQAWRDFLGKVKPALGEFAVEGAPPAPQQLSVHRFTGENKNERQ